ncbi:MAG: hypothetical protein R6V04_03795, partial [bacterium]
GQFIQIKIGSLFLRRPFSVGKYCSGRTGILVQVKGKGSALLADKKLRERISVIGPLGKGFPYRKNWKKVWFVGGGTGIAPLLFLSEELKHCTDPSKFEFFYGAREKKLIFFDILPCKIPFSFSWIC